MGEAPNTTREEPAHRDSPDRPSGSPGASEEAGTDRHRAARERRAQVRERRARRRRARRMLRARRAPSSAVIALCLVALGWLVAAEAISAQAWVPFRLVPYEQLALSATEIDWGEGLPKIVGVVCLLTGLSVIALALLPGKLRLVPLDVADPDLVVAVTRPGLRRALAHAAAVPVGVEGVAVEMDDRRVEVAVIATADAPDDLADRVRALVSREMTEIGVLGGYDVEVRLHRRQA
ncbi:DUF6286 domain-containing protein [Rhizohabitans arisaemae]|uniref:DUF6286 domain-containing protein n=1 Tax=Rhizohabitans arisaemae TaxID=2720610 RepID=UPI0024B03E8A|nr:DUF6286 domain-containing protein [Rhizohabitans arisaemae]